MTKGAGNLELFRHFYFEYPRLLVETISNALRRKSGHIVDSTLNSETACRKSAAVCPAANISWEFREEVKRHE